MDKDKKFQEIIDKFASNSKHWRSIKKVLEEDIRSNKDLIILIDKRVKEIELEMSKLN